MIQPLIQQLAQANPALAQSLNQHPELLYQLLGGMEGEGGEFDDGEGGQLPPGAQVVSVTAEEAEAIGRVRTLLFGSRLDFTMCGLNGLNFFFCFFSLARSARLPPSNRHRGVLYMRQE